MRDRRHRVRSITEDGYVRQPLTDLMQKALKNAGPVSCERLRLRRSNIASAAQKAAPVLLTQYPPNSPSGTTPNSVEVSAPVDSHRPRTHPVPAPDTPHTPTAPPAPLMMLPNGPPDETPRLIQYLIIQAAEPHEVGRWGGWLSPNEHSWEVLTCPHS
ncbi:hypothetical protein FTUN_3370 [Frigoriglobus tundricola]|uniref:Uncharacterized protein n=1 Tax=Frigoriglobus tundricola TaxID=2774151 RepID=A0A6M5YR44_9BACT|nr:hypothetical protein FTUN_3370 [Frigoriglobus tundricola]